MAGVASLQTLRNSPDCDKRPSSIIHIYYKTAISSLPSSATSSAPIHNRNRGQKSNQALTMEILRLLQLENTAIRPQKKERSVPVQFWNRECRRERERTSEKFCKTRRKSRASKEQERGDSRTRGSGRKPSSVSAISVRKRDRNGAEVKDEAVSWNKERESCGKQRESLGKEITMAIIARAHSRSESRSP